MKNLETLDVRDTRIETLPESLWNISALRHVYVLSGPRIKGPSSAAKLSDLQVLKTVTAHESWLENIPLFLIHLRKFGLSNWDNQEYESTSKLLSHMDELISMTITGDILPSEFVDIRAFPNLKTVKAIKVQGEWISRRLPIDNIKFSPNLTKLTLISSYLKEDPMPTLEKLQTLKYLSLQDEAYIGKQMVCTENGFPLLQVLIIEKMENLENLEVKPMGMSQLTVLFVSECLKFNNNLRNLDHVPDIYI
ncbi:putative disease resistance protein At1g59780 [Carex rostrata]